MSVLLNYLTQNQDALLCDLEQLVREESPSDQKAAVDKCGRFLQHLFKERVNASAFVFPQPLAGDHLRFSIGDSNRQILILGHFDTVWDVGRLAYRVEGGNAFGPGIFDMKAGIVQALWALRGVQELQLPVSRRIVFLFNTDEEMGSATSREIIEEEASRSDAVLVLEPAVAGTNALKTARKGVGRFTVRINGRAAHSGNNPEDGVSAIEEMARQILVLHALTDGSVGTTVNVGVAQGGTRSNVVADQAELHVDVRVTSIREADRMMKTICGLAPIMPGATISVEGGIARPPMEKTAATSRLFEVAYECGRNLGLDLTEASVGGGSDGNFTAALGIPTLDGLGAVGDGIHAPNEHIVIDQLPIRAALIGELILKIAD
jgi:glutamate carboxypeptidase